MTATAPPAARKPPSIVGTFALVIACFAALPAAAFAVNVITPYVRPGGCAYYVANTQAALRQGAAEAADPSDPHVALMRDLERRSYAARVDRPITAAWWAAEVVGELSASETPDAHLRAWTETVTENAEDAITACR